MHNKLSKGFTLIELLVVIAIIGLLSAVVLAALNTARAKGRDATRLSELTEMRTAIESYYVDHGTYPPTGCGIANYPTGGFAESGSENAPPAVVSCSTYISGITPTYISTLPTDPSNAVYGYIYATNGTDYKLMSWNNVEHSVPEGSADARCPLSCGNTGACTDTADFAVYSPGAACW